MEKTERKRKTILKTKIKLNNMDFNQELQSLVRYYKGLTDTQQKYSNDIEEVTKELIKDEEPNESDVDNFTDLEYKAFMVNLFGSELLKASTAIKSVYRMAVGSGKEPVVDDTYMHILKHIVSNDSLDMMFYMDGSELKYKDTLVYERIMQMCRDRVSNIPSDEHKRLLKKQYESYLKIREGQDGQEGDPEGL